MAHELTIRADGYTEMAFVGKTPWHGLGQELQQDASLEEWRKAAGMDWEIQSAPVRFEPNGQFGDLEGVENQNVLFRSDNHKPLSVVSKRYKAVQPAEVLEFFRDLVEDSGFRLHTAGTLFDGKRFWALAETGRFAEVSEGDGIGGFLLLSTSADKSLATTARFTSVRVVCNNTLSMATRSAANVVSFNHTRVFDPEAMKNKLGEAVAAFDGFMQMAKFLRTQRLSQAAAVDFVKRLTLTKEEFNDTTYDFTRKRPYKKIMELFNGGAKGFEMATDTKWGMMNAVTEYFDHHQPSRTDDARLNSTWFGHGESVKSNALEMLLTA